LITQDMLPWLCTYQGDMFGQVGLADLDLDLTQEATLILTSGSTGQPKGVLHTLANHLASARASDQIIPFGQGEVWLVSLPMYHVSGLALITRALLHGGTLLFAHKDWRTALVQETVTHLSVVPTQLRQLLAQPDTAAALKTLSAVLVGGAPCPEGLVREAQAQGISIHVTYGASECASQITTTRTDPVGCGPVLSHVQIYIDRDSEILVRGDSVGQGYVTLGQVIPLVDEQGWFHTGDLGRLDDQGCLFVLGRKDRQFTSGGENIHPEEIERVLLAVPEVEQCVVVPVADAQYGQRPVAFVLGSPDRQAVCDALRCLERFKHPDHIFDWPRELSDAMKPDRPAMQQLAESLVRPAGS
ncbi:MAG: AMP-binding protein, partial [Phycisphaerae bacterium]|nr:AMP-binding protein [Phycisphaerae bacterium]